MSTCRSDDKLSLYMESFEALNTSSHRLRAYFHQTHRYGQAVQRVYKRQGMLHLHKRSSLPVLGTEEDRFFGNKIDIRLLFLDRPIFNAVFVIA